MTRIKLALDDGHGDNGVTPGKRTPKFSDGSFMYENAFNKVVVKYLDKHLNRCGFDTILVAPTDADTPLVTRVNTANKAKVDAYISIHANAASGSWGSPEGVETFVGASSFSKKLANNVHNQLIKGTSQKNRGVKDGTHLYVIRNTIAPAILVECAFMDNEREARLLLSDSFRRECALEIAKGICESFGVKFIEEQEVKGASYTKEELTVAQYEELKKIIEAQAKRIEVLEAFAGVKERAVAPDHKVAWEWAQSQGLVNGKNPNRPLTREQFATIEYRKATKK
ncbi:N-acetylmuramoyl-L-alanine amidase [Ureibacillus chungkukjangi]|uniref:N-acetylmuramoyl-L-alanine amidase family protein n=1 Tax=Ureibacillus chungkukjangi TaxID=1202712 RepID=UPI00384E9644